VNARSDTTANTTVSEAENVVRKRRDLADTPMDNTVEGVEGVEELVEEEEECRVEMWRCLSKVIEGGLHYVDNPEGLLG
jgi:hypothetical protein